MENGSGKCRRKVRWALWVFCICFTGLMFFLPLGYWTFRYD
jgi:hypothetical protein